MSCKNSSNEVDLEDMFKELKKTDDIRDTINNNKQLYDFSERMHNTVYLDREEFLRHLAIYQRSIKNIFRKSLLRHIYKQWCKDNNKKQRQELLQYLLKNAVRTGSGVCVNTVFTSPTPEYEDNNGKVISQNFSCEYNCYFCPDEPARPENNNQKQARSYVYDGPSTRRANENGFHPVRQFFARAKDLLEQGHEVDKIETIVLGGTWNSYPIKYRDWFVKMIYYAANMLYVSEYRKPYSLEREIELNETSECHIIGFTIETRPDCITPETIKEFRKQNVTRVQIGVQHTDDKILKKVNRKCTQKDIINAIRLLKNACYKVDIHLMPDLCSTPEQDREMFDIVLYNEDYQVDQIKVYPMYIVNWTVIKKWYDSGKFVPQDKEDVINNIIYFLSKIHKRIRVNRVGRDIPLKNKTGTTYLHGDTSCMDLRQVVDKRMKEQGLVCNDIRSREPQWDEKNIKNIKLKVEEYRGSGGKEYHISMDDDTINKSYGFCRLRLTKEFTIGTLSEYALIRELHVYGPLVKVDKHSDTSSQHAGFGKTMLKKAEEIAFMNGYNKIAIISGVGVRNYYRKLGYNLEEDFNFMIKDIEYKAIETKYYIMFFMIALPILYAIIYMGEYEHHYNYIEL